MVVMLDFNLDSSLLVPGGCKTMGNQTRDDYPLIRAVGGSDSKIDKVRSPISMLKGVGNQCSDADQLAGDRGDLKRSLQSRVETVRGRPRCGQIRTAKPLMMAMEPPLQHGPHRLS